MRLSLLLSTLRRSRAYPLAAACVLLVAGLAAGGLAAALQLTSRAELQTLDWRWQMRADRHEDPRIVIVSIDDASLHRRGATWPLSRMLHAQVIEKISAMGANQVVYNQQFDLEGPSHAADDRLLTAFSRTPNLVLPATQTEDGGPRLMGGGRHNREVSGATFGSDVERRDDDGAIRRFPLRDDHLGLLSFPGAAASTARGGDLRPPSATPWIATPTRPCGLNEAATRTGRLRCDIPAYTLDALLAGSVPSDALDGKIVVVGPVGADQQVLRQTWAGGDDLMTTTELTAREIGTALRGFPLRSAPWWWGALAAMLLCAVPALAAARIEVSLAARVREPSWPASAGLVAGAGLCAAGTAVLIAGLAFRAGDVVSLVTPVVCVAVTTLLAVARIGVILRRRAADVWRTAAALAPQQLIERVVLRAGGPAAIAGEPVVMTIMFADLRSSTRYVLGLDRPEETWAFSQAFVRRAVEAVEAHKGYALSLEGGDGILAVFGPPFGSDRHARLAIAAALELTGPVLDDIREEIAERLPQLRELMDARPLGMRVSVHTGEVVFGGSGIDGEMPRRWSTSTVGRATWEAAKLRAAAAPENVENWDPAARDLIFGRPDADERIVVVSEEAMAEARDAASHDAGPEYGFVRTAVVAAGDTAIDVWVHQGRPVAETPAPTRLALSPDRVAGEDGDGEADATAPTSGPTG